MIKIIRETDDRSHSGKWNYRIVDFPVRGEAVEGRSHQPLLDGCRQIKRMGGPIDVVVELFREGREGWDLRCTVKAGSELTVSEPAGGGGPRFVRFKPFAGLG